MDPTVSKLGELQWIVDVNRQSLDRVVPEIQVRRLEAMFEAAGWQVVTLNWGSRLSAIYDEPGGADLRHRLEEMPNEEFQRILRVPSEEIPDRILRGGASTELHALVNRLGGPQLAEAIRDLGGHDLELLTDTFARVDGNRPTIVLAYTVKGKGLPTEGHPGNHSSLLSETQMHELAATCGVSLSDPWQRFDEDSSEGRWCIERAEALRRDHVSERPSGIAIPDSLGRVYRKPLSTQAALGRVLADLPRDQLALAERIVTCSPDLASSTNLGGWINKSGVWSAQDRLDWFADDPERLLRWSEGATGRHIELGIAEVNLVGLLSELGSTWSRWGERLIPVATPYDPFIPRALEPWSDGIYAGGHSILVGTPSGVTLAPEGGAHQSITTPSVGLEQPGCIAWEPAFPQDLEWTFLHAIRQIGVPGGTSSYFRLSTRPIDPILSELPEDPLLLERRRRQAIAGGYRIGDQPPTADDVTLVGVGAIMPEVLHAAKTLRRAGVAACVVCLTSPDLVYRSVRGRSAREVEGGGIAAELFPEQAPRPIVAVLDGHPHTLAFLSGVRGDRIECLVGVTEFGQSSSAADAYEIHGIDAAAIVDAALRVLGR